MRTAVRPPMPGARPGAAFSCPGRGLARVLAVVGLGLLGGCGKDAPILNAVGSYSDVAIITDVDVFNPVAFALSNALEVDAQTGIRPDPLFNVDIFDWDKRKNAALYKNVIVLGFVRGRDPASLEISRKLGGQQMKVMPSRNLYFAVRENVYANNQNVVFLAGVDRNYMQSAIAKEAAALRGQMEERNRERIRDYLYAAGRNEEAEARLRTQAGFQLQVPTAYSVNSIKQNAEGDLGCAEILTGRPTRSVVVFWKVVDPAQVDLQDTAMLLGLRRQWALFLDESLQDAFGFEWSLEMFRGEEWPLLTGLYEIPSADIGGPFRTIFLLDPMSRRLYGINWLTFYPQGDKVSYLREVRAIADTFVPRP